MRVNGWGLSGWRHPSTVRAIHVAMERLPAPATAMPGGCWVMPGGSGDRRVQGRVESLLRADGIAAVGLGQVAEARVGYRLCRFASFATK